MTNPAQIVKTKIVGLNKFQTFKEMFLSYPANEYGSENQNEWELMYKYYSTEEEQKYGVLAIRLKLA